MERKLCLFIAMSLDGYIAKPDGDISFLDEMNQEGEDYGYNAYIETVDTVLLGRKTYDKIRSMGVDIPYGNRSVYVLTRTSRENLGMTIFYSGDLRDLVNDLKSQSGKNIYCDGGAEIIQQLLADELIDEMTISVIPVILGNGIRLFNGSYAEQKLNLLDSKSYRKGLTQLHYARKIKDIQEI
jgi:Dihydrofolate reductase